MHNNITYLFILAQSNNFMLFSKKV
uniref:Uncharacterized protein n=1 Tax=Arundo donax TaxID=35708 RepID=A0A0A9FPL7_ARUDO